MCVYCWAKPQVATTASGNSMTPETEAPSSAVVRVVVDASAPGSSASVSGLRTATGSTSDSRLADVLERLADADAITASRVRAWDRLQERRA